MKPTSLFGILFLLGLGLPSHAETKAAAKTKAATEAAPTEARDAVKKSTAKVKDATKVKAIPFYGEVTAVDPAAMTVSLGGRVYLVTAESKIMNGNKPATIKDVKAGRKVGGSYVDTKGKHEVVKLNLGVKQSPAKEAPDKAGAAKETEPAAKTNGKAKAAEGKLPDIKAADPEDPATVPANAKKN